MKRITLSLGIIAVMVLGAVMSFNTTSFPGYHSGEQCGICHNEGASAYNASWADMDLTLDGIQGEEFWDYNDDHLMYIPLAGNRGFVDTYVDENGTTIVETNFAPMRFAQNSTHLFLYIRFADHTQDGAATYNNADADGVAVIFNIDQEEFMLPDAVGAWGSDSRDNWMAMDGDNLGTGKQDLVYWQPTSSDQSAPSFNTTSKEYDNATAVTGKVWDKNYGGTASENEDWSAAAIHGNVASHYENHYGVEMVRPLVTDDDNDVQFKYDGYYEFALATWNDSKGADHSVSFEHTLWVKGADGAMPLDTVTETETETETGAAGADVTVTETKTEDSPFSSLLSFFGLMTISLAVMVYRRKN